jgi:hypothetical protein
MRSPSSRTEPENPLCRGTSHCGQGNPVGALRAALTAAPVRGRGVASGSRRFAMTTMIAFALHLGLGAASFALDIRDLRPGSYIQRPAVCSALGGAGTMTFDGHNFSGHYQMCRTDALGGSRVRNTCIEAQGPTRPDPKEIDTDPDRTVVEATVSVQSPTSFTISGKQFQFCGE